MENGKTNQGIFYAVIGIATLAVAIVGATFAFFSATANSANNAIAATGAKVDLTFTDVKAGVKDSLIPVDATQAAFVNYPAASSEGCIDINNNNICSVYQFTVGNPATATASQRIYVKLVPSVNTFSNLHYAVFKGTAAQVSANTPTKFDVDGTAVTTVTNATKNTIASNGDLVISDTQLTLNNLNDIPLAPLEQVLAVGESVTYTIVLWIQETGGNQTTLDAGKAFAAGVNITTQNGNNSGVTGVLSATAG